MVVHESVRSPRKEISARLAGLCSKDVECAEGRSVRCGLLPYFIF